MIININNVTFNVDHTTGLVAKNYSFWDDVNKGIWEPHTFKVFDRFLDKNHSYIDVGAWIGPTCLYGSNLAKHVYGFEPDPTAFESLKLNLSLNQHLSNIDACQIAIGQTNGLIKMGTNSVRGDSMSSMLFSGDAWEVESITLEMAINKFNVKDINFIKIDTEGGELHILPAIKQYLINEKPTVYVALHTAWIDDKKQFLDMVKDTLSTYKNVYSNSGIKLNSLSEINNLPLMTEILATDLAW